MIKIDFLEIFNNREKYENPEYYVYGETKNKYCCYNPVLKTQMDIADNAFPVSLVIALFENRMQTLNSAGIEEVHNSIDVIIETAISYERHELTVYFMGYKEKHNLYNPPNWDI